MKSLIAAQPPPSVGAAWLGADAAFHCRVMLEDFAHLRFYVDREDIEVRVLLGHKGDKYEDERQAAIELSEKELKRFKAVLKVVQ